MGKLILAATPIGNICDASQNLKDTIQKVSLIAAEDTRKARVLIKNLQTETSAKIISFYDVNESLRIEQILNYLKDGDVLVISDAGMPLVSDPGYKLVRECIDKNIEITCLPGPSAVLTALVLSGFPPNRFCFEGFLSPKSGTKLNQLRKLINEERTMIFFESPHKITKTISLMLEVFGDYREIAICRELTKTYQEIIRGTLIEVYDKIKSHQLKGEICIVLAPKINIKPQKQSKY